MNISRKIFLSTLPGVIYVPPFLSALLEDTDQINKKEKAYSHLSKFYIKDQSDFDKYKNYTFKEGSLILFAQGKVFNGQFAPSGSGTKNNPIIVTAYNPKTNKIFIDDNIENKPLINAMGKTFSAFYLNNSAFWTISNLEIVNDSLEARKKESNLRGIFIRGEDAGTIEDITICHNYIHNVNIGFEGKKRGGIFVEVEGKKRKTKFHNLKIENNKIENTGGIGISTFSMWGRIPDEEDFYPWTNVLIRGNDISFTGRNAIIIRNSINPIIEYNRIAYSSRCSTGNSIFNFSTVGCVMQFNEVYGNTGDLNDGDRGSFDADFNAEDTIIQYNYSHGNHWFCSIMRKWNKGVIVRYNISQNELLGAYFYGFPSATGLKDLKIYNNTHYFSSGTGTEVFVSAGRVRIPIETEFFNNILFFEDKGRWSNIPDKNSCTIGKNIFHNFNKEGLNEIVANPLFEYPGNGRTDIDMHNDNRLEGYRLQENSPAIATGKLVENNGGKDFWGNELSSRSTDFGA